MSPAVWLAKLLWTLPSPLLAITTPLVRASLSTLSYNNGLLTSLPGPGLAPSHPSSVEQLAWSFRSMTLTTHVSSMLSWSPGSPTCVRHSGLPLQLCLRSKTLLDGLWSMSLCWLLHVCLWVCFRGAPWKGFLLIPTSIITAVLVWVPPNAWLKGPV